MDKIKRNERLGALTRILLDTPNRIHTLGEFCELFGAAKSTVSEDIDLLSSALEHFLWRSPGSFAVWNRTERTIRCPSSGCSA